MRSVQGDIVFLSGDKDSCVIIMNREDYVKKVDDLINDGVNQGVYAFTEDKTHEDLHNFRTFIYNFGKCAFYDALWSNKSQPGRLFCTAKTRKFNDLKLILILRRLPHFCPSILSLYKTRSICCMIP